MVSASSLGRSGRVHKAFCHLYLSFHRLPIEFFFDHFGTFAYVEGLVYEADTANERLGGERTPTEAVAELVGYLSRKGLLDARCRNQLTLAIEYFQFENKLLSNTGYSLEDATRAASIRSFDFRLLHRIVFQLNSWVYDEDMFQRFAVFEELMEFDDDCQSCARDERANTFNIVNCLAEHGQEALTSYVGNLVVAVRLAEKQGGGSFSRLLSRYTEFVPNSALTTYGNAQLMCESRDVLR